MPNQVLDRQSESIISSFEVGRNASNDAEGRDLGKAYRFDLPANRKLAEKVKEIAKRDGVSLTAVCLAFITSQDSNSMAVVGASSVKQLEETLSCSDYSLGKEDIEELSEIRGMSI